MTTTADLSNPIPVDAQYGVRARFFGALLSNYPVVASFMLAGNDVPEVSIVNEQDDEGEFGTYALILCSFDVSWTFESTIRIDGKTREYRVHAHRYGYPVPGCRY